MLDQKRRELFASVGKQQIGTDHQTVRPQLSQPCEGIIDLASGTSLDNIEAEADRVQGPLGRAFSFYKGVFYIIIFIFLWRLGNLSFQTTPRRTVRAGRPAIRRQRAKECAQREEI